MKLLAKNKSKGNKQGKSKSNLAFKSEIIALKKLQI
jgi:hypothetical protein